MDGAQDRRASRLPLGLKWAFTAFVAVHVAVNWAAYGPLNFLWMCDAAVLTLAVALWTESRLLLGMAAVGICMPLALWGLDLAVRLGTGHYWLGFAGYMFDRRVPTAVRATSTFHIWLPVVLGFALQRLGYDRRAFAAQCGLILLLLPLCRLISDAPPRHGLHETVNVNWVYGLNDDAPQTLLPAPLYLAVMVLGFQLLFYLPTHVVLVWWFKADDARVAVAGVDSGPGPAENGKGWLPVAGALGLGR